MCIKKFAAVILTAVIFAGCTAQTAEEENIPQEEKERAAIASWFAESMTDEEAFPDVKDYQYYARAVGLDKDVLLFPDMWEVYYNDEININREIDGKAIYLIRLDPDKLLEIYAANNNSTAEGKPSCCLLFSLSCRSESAFLTITVTKKKRQTKKPP